ncbi:hypothetical protein ACHAQH_003632 [Verticillium albo-atrum]
MAEAVGLASGVLALAVFACKSCKTLLDTIQSFHAHPRQVRDLSIELLGLNSILGELSQNGDLDLGVDLSALKMTLDLCRRACDDVAVELLTYCSRSGIDKASFRDWLKLKYSGGDGIDGFRRQLIGYKSTINVALSFATLRTSATTAEDIQSCRALLATTTIDLEARLEDIQQMLTTFTERTNAQTTADSSTRQRVEEELLSTEKGLELCTQLSQHIEQIQADFAAGRHGPSNARDANQNAKALVGEGLDACKDYMRFALERLKKHQESVNERLRTGGTAPNMSDDEATLDQLHKEEETLRRSLGFISNVDAYLEGQISNIENYAEGDDTIQFMVSTNGKTINGKNRGIGQRQKQAGGHFDETSLQQVSEDFKSISLHQTEVRKLELEQSISGRNVAGAGPASPFKDRHGRGFSLVPKMSGAATVGTD